MNHYAGLQRNKSRIYRRTVDMILMKPVDDTSNQELRENSGSIAGRILLSDREQCSTANFASPS